jgi:hypothetical protein
MDPAIAANFCNNSTRFSGRTFIRVITRIINSSAVYRLVS